MSRKKPHREQLSVDDAIRATNAANQERRNDLRYSLRMIDFALLGIDDLRAAHVHEFVMGVASNLDHVRGYPGAACVAPIAVIATSAGLSIDQAKRARAEAKRLGIVKTVRWYHQGERTDDLTVIVLNRIEQLGKQSREPRSAAPTCAQVRSAAPSRSQLLPRALTYKEPDPNPDPKLKSSSSPSPPDESSAAVGSAGWRAVEEELLFRCEMNQAEKACRHARANGAEPADVLAVIGFWHARRGAWGRYDVPELYQRIRRCALGDRDRPASRWPPTQPGWRDPETTAHVGARKAAAAAEQEASEAAAAAAAADRERRLGAALDALGEEEVLTLLGGQRVWVKAWREGKFAGEVRDELLTRLEVELAKEAIA